MPQQVTDARSNANDQIDHAAKVLGRSEDKIAVFEAIYYHKTATKTVSYIEERTGLSRMRVLQLANDIHKQHLAAKTRVDGEVAYTKDQFYDANKKRILALARDPKKRMRMPTKTRPSGSATGTIVQIRIPRQRIQTKQITVDHIDSFSKVRKVRPAGDHKAMLEADFKKGVQQILGQSGSFKDWGGEKNDLLTTRVRMDGRRIPAAFAFKGRGQKGKLTPAKLGKNGDQIQRLFQSTAELFLVHYWDEIHESVVDQMAEFAKAKSVSEGKRIYFGIIDGDDAMRLLQAYPSKFKKKRRR